MSNVQSIKSLPRAAYDWRTDRNLTQKQASELVGIAYSAWSNLERGKEVSDTVTKRVKALVQGHTPVSDDLEKVLPRLSDAEVLRLRELATREVERRFTTRMRRAG